MVETKETTRLLRKKQRRAPGKRTASRAEKGGAMYILFAIGSLTKGRSSPPH
jgi:hypothetical protein